MIDCYAGSSLSVKDIPTISQSGGDVAIRLFTASGTQSIEACFEGGHIIGKRAIWIHLAGSDKEVAPQVNLKIKDGVFNCTSPDTQHVIYSYSYGNSYENVNVTIDGGSFCDSNIAFGGGYKGDKEKVSITGGMFEFDVIRYTESGKDVIKEANGVSS